jgi:maltose alpha-D-glucosyltransferase/alpha-amylase
VRTKPDVSRADDALWYKDAIIYEVHPKAFRDANGDGIGDFRGLTEKLDYLRDLGVTALWILPFYPSPLRDDGYDIADYTDVHPNYGTLRDFEALLREAHRRGLRVITELVLNHTSDQHAWFQRARRAARGSSHRNFYVWSDSPERYAEARIIFKDFEASNWTWDPVAGAYYWHRFYSHQPDLNYESPAVRRAMLQRVDFWLERGVDGLRLDAVPYLYEQDGSNCENLPETHAFLQMLRRHVDERFPNRMLLAEANQWPEDAVAYFGEGNECHMAFHFPLMPRLFMGIHMEDCFPIIDILEQTPPTPDGCQWALFLRNHDELTLEMVTDEERDYMYRVYASDPQARLNLGIRRRLAPLLGNHRRKIELMNGLLLSLPGTPVLYYGDEIGMGDNIYLGDRNGVRTPMQWSADRNAGFSQANPQRLYLPIVIDPEYNPDALNVEAQQNNVHSLLWWMKRLIALRKRFRAFGRGSIEFLHPENHRVLAFLRQYDGERILVVANLSRYVQFVELDLAAAKGSVPVELFGNTDFPPIGSRPYFLSLGPHSFYWFALRPPRENGARASRPKTGKDFPEIAFSGLWSEADVQALENVLPSYLATCRWFAGSSKRVKSLAVTDLVSGPDDESEDHRIAIVSVTYADVAPEVYALPLACAWGEEVTARAKDRSGAVVARVRRGERAGVLHDATFDAPFAAALLDAVVRRRRLQGQKGRVLAAPRPALHEFVDEGSLEPSILKGAHRNTSIVYGDRLILKLFRRLEEGTNQDLEVGRFLTENTDFAHTPPVAGMLSYEPRGGGRAATLGILHGFLAKHGDALSYTLGTLPAYFDHALLRPPPLQAAPATLGAQVRGEVPPEAQELFGAYLASVALLGQRTAELHGALASRADVPEFAPEAFSTLYQRSLYQSMRTSARQTCKLLRRQSRNLPVAARAQAYRVLDLESTLDRRLRAILAGKLVAGRIRCHGDLHLGQMIHTGRDFVVIDFEGDPTRPPGERRIKRSPLRDVGSMLRSFHDAVFTAWTDPAIGPVLRPEDQTPLADAVRFWYRCVAATFLRGYLAAASPGVLPRAEEDLVLMLDVYMIEKTLRQIDDDLLHPPGAILVHLEGLLEVLGADGEETGAAE